MERATGVGKPPEDHDVPYDASGNRIRDASHLTTVLADAGDVAWLVPALVLSATTDEKEAASG